MATATATTTQSLRSHLVEVMHRYSSGQLAQAARVSKRTAENWRAGRAVPTGDALLTLMRQNDEIMERLLGRPLK